VILDLVFSMYIFVNVTTFPVFSIAPIDYAFDVGKIRRQTLTEVPLHFKGVTLKRPFSLDEIPLDFFDSPALPLRFQKTFVFNRPRKMAGRLQPQRLQPQRLARTTVTNIP